jgi:bifunctional DNA-binding transcriptional regulator/antitoxin component of YhaV-PrlF toxin-antitoxin module
MKLLRLTPNTYAVTIPKKYREALSLGFGDYLEIGMFDRSSLVLRKYGKPRKI